MRLLLLSLSILLTGCAQLHVSVSSTATSDVARMRTFAVMAKNDSSLEAQKIADYLSRSLESRGYVRSPAERTTDMLVVFEYFTLPPKFYTNTYSTPEYGMIGGGSMDFNATTHYGLGNSAQTHGTIYQQPRYGVVGSSQHTRTHFILPVGLRIVAADYQAFRTRRQSKTIWTMTVTAAANNSDLKIILPTMIDAASPYFGKDLPHKITTNVRSH